MAQVLISERRINDEVEGEPLIRKFETMMVKRLADPKSLPPTAIDSLDDFDCPALRSGLRKAQAITLDFYANCLSKK